MSEKWIWFFLAACLAAIAFNVMRLKLDEKSETNLDLGNLLASDSIGGGLSRTVTLTQCNLEIVEKVERQCGLPSRPPAAIVERTTLIDLSKAVRIRFLGEKTARPRIAFFFDEQTSSDGSIGFSREIERCDGMVFESHERSSITFELSIEKFELTKSTDFEKSLDLCAISDQ